MNAKKDGASKKLSWVLSEYGRYLGGGQFTIIDDTNDPRVVAECKHEDCARLCAAAPDLLEACRDALMQFEHNGDECPEDRAVLDRLQAVIAKAETGKDG